MRKRYIKKNYQNLSVLTVADKHLNLVLAALNLIKKADKSSFSKVLRTLKFILVPTVRGYLNGTYEKDRAWIVEGEMLENNTTSFVASMIIHEAHHVAQYLSGHKYKLPNSEISALKEQKKFLWKIKDEFSLKWLEGELKRQWWKDVVGNKVSTKRLDKHLAALKRAVGKK